MFHVLWARVSQPPDKALAALVSLCPLHARLSLNTWRAKPEGTGWGAEGGRGLARLHTRRRGDVRKDPKCFDLRARGVCGCVPLRVHSHLAIPPSLLFSLSPALSASFQGYSLLFLSDWTLCTLLFLSVGGPCEALQCKCLLCCLIHFHWDRSFGGNGFRVCSLSLPRSTCTMGRYLSEGRSGLGWERVGVFRGLDCSMWSKRGSCMHVSAAVIVSAQLLHSFVFSLKPGFSTCVDSWLALDMIVRTWTFLIQSMQEFDLTVSRDKQPLFKWKQWHAIVCCISIHNITYYYTSQRFFTLWMYLKVICPQLSLKLNNLIALHLYLWIIHWVIYSHGEVCLSILFETQFNQKTFLSILRDTLTNMPGCFSH